MNKTFTVFQTEKLQSLVSLKNPELVEKILLDM
jgi:hypothetical protein